MSSRRKYTGRWNVSQLEAAVDAVRNGSSIKSASKSTGIPRKTLSDYVKRGRGAEKLKSGIKAVFSTGDEDQLVQRIKRLQKVGFPVTRDDIRRTAFEVAESLGIA